MSSVDTSFRALGTTVRLMLGGRDAPAAAQDARAWLERFDACASRFRPGSELRALNADARATVPVSPLLCATVGAGIWAAHRTGGLVDPSLLDAVEACGYTRSWDPARALDPRAALAAAPARQPAAAHPAAAWRAVRCDPAALTVTRPPGLRLDSGGTGKGLAADVLAQRVGARRAVVDVGGDIALVRPPGDEAPFEILVAHPFGGATAAVLQLDRGGVATSGLGARIWAGTRGPAHHLFDPSTGRPAWTGLASVTALAPSALEAEVLAKAALLSGRDGAGAWLAQHGGVVVHDDGAVELAGPLSTSTALAA
ncbi:MAG TPA: FAD:protein FMN transferase [Baekduia sp.]|uniref:FAD:protein FMN transferase n=1 Tax=Baekduia sp. TaxID=2600305 RepID=UPI002C3862EB|nr:FAD:protein FMN transferase [Baekduia sp.]HMJ32591.1 FAD:protein FMN transferase [Baekduia sp.]